MTDFPDLKMKAQVSFPARVDGGAGIDVTKSNGTYRFDLDFGDFAPPITSLTDPAHQNALLWNSITGHYDLIPAATLAGGADIVSVKSFGAKVDGVTDDIAAINTALATFDAVSIPQGTCKVSGTIVMARTNQKLVGAGRNLTTLMSTSASGALIQLSGGNFVEVSGLTLDRSVTPDSSGNGIQQGAAYNQGFIHNIQVGNQYFGIVLAGVSYGTLRDIVAHSNYSDGILISGSAVAGGTLQWNIDNILSQVNNGNGIRVTTFDNTPMILGEPWRNITTFANSGYGINLQGTSTGFIADINITGGFFGSDGLGEIRLDTFSPAFGVQTTISNIQIEHTGDGPTGRALGTAATHTGHGIVITANNPAVSLTNISMNNVSEDGIFSAGAMTVITHAIITNSGKKCSGSNRNGIEISAGSAIITNIATGNDGTTTQQNGILIGASSSGCLVTNNNVSYKSGSAVAGISNSSTTSRIMDNIGYNPVGATTVTTTGSSPYSYTSGASPEDAWFTSPSSTITGATLNGGNILPTGIGGNVVFTVRLGPRETVVISGFTGATLVHMRFVH
jgi:hypothetical protein